MAKVKGYIQSVNIDYNNIDVVMTGGPAGAVQSIPGPPEAHVELLITEGDIGALLDHMQGVTSPIEIEIPDRTVVKDPEAKVRKWRLIEVGAGE